MKKLILFMSSMTLCIVAADLTAATGKYCPIDYLEEQSSVTSPASEDVTVTETASTKDEVETVSTKEEVETVSTEEETKPLTMPVLTE